VKKNDKPVFLQWRFCVVLIGFICIIAVLLIRMVYLTILDRSFLLKQSNARSLRVISKPAYRGMILDRNGEPLAVSTPVNSVWLNPHDFPNTKENIYRISHLLHLSPDHLKKLLYRNRRRQFVYIERGVNPDEASQVKRLGIPGIYLEQEYKRYYPKGEVTAQVVGFTDIDEKGVEGLELAFDEWLKGKVGKEKILKDLYGNTVAVLSDVRKSVPGEDLCLSIDSRIQFLAYRVLKETVEKYDACSGSVVVLNPNTGEVLAMVNQPSYNPNRRPKNGYDQFRNRAVTDVFEPGSTLKIFSIMSALDSGLYTSNTLVDTNPGWLKIGQDKVRDEGLNHSILNVAEILQKSSNVGVAKIILSLPPEQLIDVLNRVGFGRKTTSGFPGEGIGVLRQEALWKPFVLATLAFGYGISVTPLQLAAAYSVIATQGSKCPVTFLKRTEQVHCEPIFDAEVTKQALEMLESVVYLGTGKLARVEGYRVAGKTGTAYIAGPHGYQEKRYESSFVGIAPVSHPQLVIVVVIRDPQGRYYGSLVAAPAFAKIMGGSLRILNILPDAKA
jgi:cell division protein FtsI (penicillin-binding protein 3)